MKILNSEKDTEILKLHKYTGGWFDWDSYTAIEAKQNPQINASELERKLFIIKANLIKRGLIRTTNEKGNLTTLTNL